MNPPFVSSADFGVDNQNPWLGLASFTEELSSYFHGRENETAELFRLLKRETLTVFFGQSGLGKTSMLNARLGRTEIGRSSQGRAGEKN
jgi:ABC-type transport system involved in cytochrome bd biosynthesis fused ATPase/permease subunit